MRKLILLLFLAASPFASAAGLKPVVPAGWDFQSPMSLSSDEVINTFNTVEKDGSPVTISLKESKVVLKAALGDNKLDWRRLLLSEYGKISVRDRTFPCEGRICYRAEFEYNDHTSTMEPAIIQGVVIDGKLYSLNYNNSREAFQYHLPTVRAFLERVRLAPPLSK